MYYTDDECEVIIACQKGNIEELKRLKNECINLDIHFDNEHALIVASQHDNLLCCQYLVEECHAIVKLLKYTSGYDRNHKETYEYLKNFM